MVFDMKKAKLIINGCEISGSVGLTEIKRGENSGANGDDEGLYRKAVKIVLEDKKTSISYLQNKMGIRYNEAASLIVRMEKEGILSAPDRTGRRVIVCKYYKRFV